VVKEEMDEEMAAASSDNDDDDDNFNSDDEARRGPEVKGYFHYKRKSCRSMSRDTIGKNPIVARCRATRLLFIA
jgi:hypothetical protein